jgi:hypothetical protein
MTLRGKGDADRVDRELRVELRVRDVTGREAIYAETWAPFGSSVEGVAELLHIVTGLTTLDGRAFRAEVRITDPLADPAVKGLRNV